MGNSIETYRKRKNISRTDLAKQTGISRLTLLAIEKGIYNPPVNISLLIAKKLNTKVENLYS